MPKFKPKYLLDLIPLIILTAYAIYLVWEVASNNLFFFWRHIFGLILLPVNYFLFWWRHKVGVIALGLTLFMGLFGLLSYNLAISMYTFYVGQETKFPIFYGQTIFLLWLLIHFIISGRYYFGILTKKYWKELLYTPPKTITSSLGSS